MDIRSVVKDIMEHSQRGREEGERIEHAMGRCYRVAVCMECGKELDEEEVIAGGKFCVNCDLKFEEECYIARGE